MLGKLQQPVNRLIATRGMFYPCVAIMAFAGVAGCASPGPRAVFVANEIKGIAAGLKFNPAGIGKSASSFRKSDFSKKRLRRYSDKTIILLSESVHEAAFYFPEERRYGVMQKMVFEEKVRRRTQRPYDIMNMYKTYLGARMFKKAAALKRRFPDARYPSIPETVLSSGLSGRTRWSVYDISDGGKKAELKVLPLDQGVKLVVVMHTGCSVAEKALGQILADDGLAADFRKYGLLVTERFDSYGVAMWKDHLDFPGVYIVNKASDFPGFNFYDSPQFFFLKNGQIVFSFVGWDGGSGLDKSKTLLYKGFRAIKS